jgi:hypothetical protein
MDGWLKMISKQTKTYQSYLLRCWLPQEIGPGDPPVWRVVVETVSNETRRRGFNTFEDLVAFLQAELLDRNIGRSEF